MVNDSKGTSDVALTQAPELFAVLMAISVASYAICTPMMVKILEAKETSIFSMIVMMGLTVIGARIGDSIHRNLNKFLGVLVGILCGGLGVAICMLDAFDVIYIPGPKLMATATGDSVFFITTYVLSDVVSEVFGYRASRLTGNVSAIFAVTVATVGKLLTAVPVPEYAAGNEAAFSFVYGGGIYVAVAGVIIYAVGDFFNDLVFRTIKKKKSGVDFGSYSLRAIGSSLVGKTADLALFSLLVMIPFSNESICQILHMDCWGMDMKSILGNFLLGVTLQITLECAFSPVSYIISKKVRARISKDTSAKISLNA